MRGDRARCRSADAPQAAARCSMVRLRRRACSRCPVKRITLARRTGAEEHRRVADHRAEARELRLQRRAVHDHAERCVGARLDVEDRDGDVERGQRRRRASRRPRRPTGTARRSARARGDRSCAAAGTRRSPRPASASRTEARLPVTCGFDALLAGRGGGVRGRAAAAGGVALARVERRCRGCRGSPRRGRGGRRRASR